MQGLNEMLSRKAPPPPAQCLQYTDTHIIVLHFHVLVLEFVCFETGSHCVSLTSLELSM